MMWNCFKVNQTHCKALSSLQVESVCGSRSQQFGESQGPSIIHQSSIHVTLRIHFSKLLTICATADDGAKCHRVQVDSLIDA